MQHLFRKKKTWGLLAIVCLGLLAIAYAVFASHMSITTTFGDGSVGWSTTWNREVYVSASATTITSGSNVTIRPGLYYYGSRPPTGTQSCTLATIVNGATTGTQNVTPTIAGTYTHNGQQLQGFYANVTKQPSVRTTYRMTCTVGTVCTQGVPGGACFPDSVIGSHAVTVSVNAPPPPPTPTEPPTATLEARNITTGGAYTNILTITPGDQIGLRWSSTDATGCSGTNFSTGGSTSGTQNNVSEPVAGDSKTYTVLCAGSGNPGSDSIEVTSVPVIAPTVSSNETIVTLGNTATVNWDLNGNNPASCTFTGSGVPGSINAQTGSFDLVVQGETTIKLSCLGGDDEIVLKVVPRVYEE